MVTCAARIPSVELGAIIPFSELQKRNLCTFQYKDEISLSPGDIAWCDILFIMRGTSPRSVWAAQEAKKLGRLVLSWWDDDLVDIPAFSLSYQHYSSPEVKKNINILFQLSDAFFSPSPILAANLSHLQVAVVNVINSNVLPEPMGARHLKPFRQQSQHIPVVGFSGSLDHRKQLDSLLGPALAAAATSTNFKVHIIGPKPNFIDKLPVKTIHTQYMQNYYDYLTFASKLNWDIGLAPQVDDEFTNCKYHVKLLEYTHIGCAGIYSKVDLYSGVIVDGITGLLVDNEVTAWEDAIVRLLKDPELRFKIASNAYEFVQSHHNREIVSEKYAAVLGPFLRHRAPTIRKTYTSRSILPNKFKQLYTRSAENIKIHGMKHYLWVAPRYLFFIVRQSLFHKITGK